MGLTRLAAILILPTVVSAQTWRGLAIAPEHRCSEYAATDYSYSWTLEADVVARQGGIYSPYDGRWFDSLGETDIEHVVARSEAHDSGLCAATAERRRNFANDIENLTLSEPGLNRRIKGARDAGEWLPQSNRCWYAATIVRIKIKYALTVDIVEAAALERVLRSCPVREMQFTRRPSN